MNILKLNIVLFLVFLSLNDELVYGKYPESFLSFKKAFNNFENRQHQGILKNSFESILRNENSRKLLSNLFKDKLNHANVRNFNRDKVLSINDPDFLSVFQRFGR